MDPGQPPPPPSNPSSSGEGAHNNSDLDGGGVGGVYFESIDIQPDLRIPSPQPPFWMRCWQPIGSAVMDTGVLKEPRGFMRIIQWLFAILAFATCAHFSTYMQYSVQCSGTQNVTLYNHTAYYPFNLANAPVVTVKCGTNAVQMYPPGDFTSDAQFFVFTGVISFLATMGILVVYVFFSAMYAGDDKKGPMIDFCFTVVIAVFWLSASAAWANGLVGMKSVFDGNWIFTDKESICHRTSAGTFFNTSVQNCAVTYPGSYGGANISVIFGFLNFFLWSANLWFLYKETAWFSGRSPQPQQQQTEG